MSRILALALLLLAVSATAADARERQRLSITSTQAIVDTTDGRLTLVGDLEGTLGDGASVNRSVPRAGGVDATFTIYTERGTIRGTASVESTAPGQEGVPGSSTYDGSARFVGGTGAYRGARGRATVRATSEPGSIIIVFTLDGVLRLP